MDWEHLRTFEAVARLGSLTGAATSLGRSQSTVSRHVAALEHEAGTALLLRGPPLVLTARGQALLEAVEPMVAAAVAARSRLEEQPALVGTVRVAATAEVVRWLLVPVLEPLLEAHPGLRLELLANNANVSLAAGEADVALRMGRPDKGELVGRRLQTMAFGLFGAASLALADDTPWVGLAGTLARIPEASAARAMFRRPARVLVEDVESLGRLVWQGVGVGVLPVGLAAQLSGVVAVQPAAVGAVEVTQPDRSLWLLVHASRRTVPRVRAVMDWVTEAVQRGRAPSSTVSTIAST